MVALALILVGVILALRFAIRGPDSAIGLLLVIPVALVAAELGWWGGLGAGVVGGALNLLSLLMVGLPVTVVGLIDRMTAFIVVGGAVGHVVAQRAQLEEESRRWLSMSHDLLGTASLDGYFTRVNPAWERCLGYTPAEIMGRPYVELIHPDDLASTVRAAGALAEGPSEILDFENRYRTKDGGWRWILWSASSDGEQVFVVGKDITERKRDDQQREHLLTKEQILARTDRVTGLPNRRAWDEQLERRLSLAAAQSQSLGVLLLDLDDFKQFNDEHGHQEGDALLSAAGASWRAVTRDGDYLARLGGDEFAMLLANYRPADSARLMVRLERVTPRGQECSMGLAYWDGSESAADLTGRADRALYADKRGVSRAGTTAAA